MSANETTKLDSNGGPIFRRPDLSHEEFATAWHRHGQLCTPWCLNSGVWEYIQIHMPSPSTSKGNPESTSTSEAADETIESKARRILEQADGVAIMRRYQVPADEGKQYFESVILADERRFLHDESGAGAKRAYSALSASVASARNSKQLLQYAQSTEYYAIKALHVDVWREMALRMGGVEYVKIRDGKDVGGGAIWDEWKRVEKEKEEAKIRA
ncbi:hypothetical protein FHL15_003746 [Xylaria flabelliformis]|uniref:EthD domain-containing protein n=1 Tax=Xylaria flabelliformis TaxID=2512241 RepID=A0A553I5D1_9PEZI|nr:hypothetical protein FHL15_003746 [Xylaria flabelliformis]